MNILLGAILLGLSVPSCRTGTAQDQPPAGQAPQNPSGVTKEEIKKFVQAKFSDDAIVAYIRAHPPNPPICCDDLTELKQAGASNEVIKALIDLGNPQEEQPSYTPPADSETPDYSAPEDYSSSYYYPYYYPYYPYYYPSYPPVFFFHDRRFEHDRRLDRDRGVDRFRHPEAERPPRAHESQPPRPSPSPHEGRPPAR